MDDTITIEKQIKTVEERCPHIVVLGAGASKASCIDTPEKNGMKIPLMNDLPKIIDISEELKDLPPIFQHKNFETIFSTLHKDKSKSDILNKIETKVFNYFKLLKLADTPTIYDYLILCLRNKDVIATFNWDPFLWQAYERNRNLTDNLPDLLFLHGNVAIGIDEESKTYGPTGYVNYKTGRTLKQTRLLYPIETKDYSSDPFISEQWAAFAHYLKRPARVTIFGYSAPKTDIEAINIMKKSWGKPEKDQVFTQFEVIDIQKEEVILKSWKKFIHSHHYEITNNFFDSSIVRFPRRSGEVFFANYLEGKWYEENYPPKFKSMKEMHEWYRPFIDREVYLKDYAQQTD